MISVFPDKNDVVRNVELRVAQNYDGKTPYVYRSPSLLKRHVSRVVVLVPSEEVSSSCGSLSPAGGECRAELSPALSLKSNSPAGTGSGLATDDQYGGN